MLHRLRQPASLALNLAPMVDVMMCLLIFFMMATRMVEQESSRIDLPAAAAAKEIDKQELGDRVVINVRDGGEAGAEYLIREQSLSLESVLGRIRQESQLNPDINCVIRADRNVSYRHVEALLRGCAAAGVSRITFSALQQPEGGA